ncbi:MFS transporter [Polymorphospora sp. NPDC051019]|uniref:MFS transporter n=1 Tax=Polymorphospora sp. NPDC051019 TaxID=3155725 RepID=UPI0034408B20
MPQKNPVHSGTRQTGGRRWLGLCVLMLPALLASLELTVTHLALPTIGADLGASSSQQLWIVDIYAFALAGAMLAMGSLGDRIGRRRLLMLGAAVFAVASTLAAYAPNAETLIAVRALMGIAGSTLMPSVLALAATLFTTASQRRVAIGAVIASVSAGTAIGPLVGGWLLDRFWWGSVFLIGMPVMALLLVLGPWLLPERHGDQRGRIDVLSALLTVGAVLPVVYALKQIATGNGEWTSPLLLALGLALGTAFVRRQRRLPDPMVDLTLFRDPAFGAALATLAFGIFVLWGANYAIAQYLQLVQGLSPLRAGLWTAPSALGVIAGSTAAPQLVRLVRPATVIAGGLLVATAGFVVLTRIGSTDGLATLVTGAVIVSAGLGPMMALATDLVIGSAPPERAGSASAMASTSPQLGGALGIAVLGSVIAARYRDLVGDRIPTGVPADAAASATDSLAAAVDLGARLSTPAGPALADAARAAFVGGFQLTAAVSAAVTLALAVATIAVLRTARSRPTLGGGGP